MFRRIALVIGASAALFAAGTAQPGNSWGPLLTPKNGWEDFEAVHVIHLEGGLLMMFQGHFGSGTANVPVQTYLYDVSSKKFLDDQEGNVIVPANIFCAGHIHTANGDVLVVGGHDDYHVGTKDVFLFERASLTWRRLGSLNIARWYPSVVVLPDGRALAFGGERVPDDFVQEVEMYDPGADSWTVLRTAPNLGFRYYPFMVSFYHPSEPDGFGILMMGPRLVIFGQGVNYHTHTSLSAPPDTRYGRSGHKARTTRSPETAPYPG